MRLTAACGLAALAVLCTAARSAAAPLAYVPNSASGNVSVIDTATDTVVDTFPVESYIQSSDVSADGLRIYVSSLSSGNVHVISAFDHSNLATINASYFGVGSTALNPSNTRLYATAPPGVAVIDTVSNTILTTITDPSLSGMNNLVVTPDGAKLYVTNAFGPITVIDTATNTVLTTLPTFFSTRGIDVLPNGSKVYIVEDGWGVRVIDPATDTNLTTIPLFNGIGVAAHPDGSKVYVSTTTGLTVVDTSTDTIVTSIPLGSTHFGLAVHPDGSRVYVASYSSDEVFVVDTATNTSLGSIPVGDEPFARGKFIGPDFVCGNGIHQPGEECDDGDLLSGDGCSSTCQLDCGQATTSPKVVIAKLDTPVGDDKLTFTGKVTLPAAMPVLNPPVTGARVRLKDAAGTLVDATLPGGVYVKPGPGWKTNGAGTTWTYLDKTLTPIQGIFKVVVVDKSAHTPGLVKFTVQGKKGSYAIAPMDLPVSGLIQLDPTDPGPNCAAATFPGPAPICAFNTTGKVLKCK